MRGLMDRLLAGEVLGNSEGEELKDFIELRTTGATPPDDFMD
jgi:hypothetical protein